MSASVSVESFLDSVVQSRLLDSTQLHHYREQLRASGDLPDDAETLAERMIADGLLTRFQAKQLLLGRFKGFIIGEKYRILEMLGSGGMGSVFLCEHIRLQTLVALKFLPKQKTGDALALERFFREARAAATLRHPNIVHASDIDQENDLHFLVMEFVDGINLHTLVAQRGPLPVPIAASCIAQAALGLQAAHERGWVHRDIKPANLLLARTGVVKILDLGLARLFDHSNLSNGSVTEKFDEKSVVGTADFLSPEQSLDSTAVDIRSDIYSLGATLYYLLAGKAPFQDGTVTQKLLWLSLRDPEPIQKFRNDIPPELAAILQKMMAKAPEARFQTPLELVVAIAPIAGSNPPLIPPEWLPTFSPALAKYGLASRTTAETATLTSTTSLLVPTSQQTSTWSGHSSSAWPSVVVQASGVFSAYQHPFVPITAGSDPSLVGRLRWQRRWLGLAVALAVFFIVGVVWWASRNKVPATNEPTFELRVPIIITANMHGVPKTFIEASARVQNGDRVVFFDKTYSESIVIDQKLGRDVTIVGVGAATPEEMTEICPPREHPNNQPLVTIRNASQVTIRDLAFSGMGQLRTLVQIEGDCAGLLLENVEFRDFCETGLALVGCVGESKHPVRVTGCRFVSAGQRSTNASSAIRVLPSITDKTRLTRHLEVSDCRIEGWSVGGVRLDASVSDVRLMRNRVYRVDHALHWTVADPAGLLNLTLTGNTFAKCRTLLRVDQLAPERASCVSLRDNLLLDVQSLVSAKDESLRAEVVKLFTDSSGNVRNATVKIAGQDLLIPGVAEREIEPIPTDPSQPAHFLTYPRTSPLLTAGTNGGPVGVPPKQ